MRVGTGRIPCVVSGHFILNRLFRIDWTRRYPSNPARFAIATHKDNLTTDYIKKSRVFSISVLEQNVDLNFLGPWGFNSGTEVDKFSNCNFKTGKSGAPIVLDKTLAYIDCEVDAEIDTGSHIMFIGKAVDAEVLNDSAPPLTYGYYRDVIKGMSPENAPTYTEKSKLSETEIIEESKLKKFQCIICGYIYNPEEGDASKNAPPGTAFEDLPESWTCPICGVGKEEFKQID